MKKIVIICAAMFALTSCVNRLGDLTLLSNRNFDKSEKYEKLASEVQVKVKTKKNDCLERAVDKATSSVPGGEYLMNVSIWVSMTGKKIKLKGDVYGVPPTNSSK